MIPRLARWSAERTITPGATVVNEQQPTVIEAAPSLPTAEDLGAQTSDWAKEAIDYFYTKHAAHTISLKSSELERYCTRGGGSLAFDLVRGHQPETKDEEVSLDHELVARGYRLIEQGAIICKPGQQPIQRLTEVLGRLDADAHFLAGAERIVAGAKNSQVPDKKSLVAAALRLGTHQPSLETKQKVAEELSKALVAGYVSGNRNSQEVLVTLSQVVGEPESSLAAKTATWLVRALDGAERGVLSPEELEKLRASHESFTRQAYDEAGDTQDGRDLQDGQDLYRRQSMAIRQVLEEAQKRHQNETETLQQLYLESIFKACGRDSYRRPTTSETSPQNTKAEVDTAPIDDFPLTVEEMKTPKHSWRPLAGHWGQLKRGEYAKPAAVLAIGATVTAGMTVPATQAKAAPATASVVKVISLDGNSLLGGSTVLPEIVSGYNQEVKLPQSSVATNVPETGIITPVLASPTPQAEAERKADNASDYLRSLSLTEYAKSLTNLYAGKYIPSTDKLLYESALTLATDEDRFPAENTLYPAKEALAWALTISTMPDVLRDQRAQDDIKKALKINTPKGVDESLWNESIAALVDVYTGQLKQQNPNLVDQVSRTVASLLAAAEIKNLSPSELQGLVDSLQAPGVETLPKEKQPDKKDPEIKDAKDLNEAIVNALTTLVEQDPAKWRNRAYLVQAMLTEGYSLSQAAGAVGNAAVEAAGVELDPTRKQYGDGPGRGIWQHGSFDTRYDRFGYPESDAPRQGTLRWYAAEHGLEWDTIEAQVGFFFWEMEHTYAAADKTLRAVKGSATEAAEVFMNEYEKPAVRIVGQRGVYAEQTFEDIYNLLSEKFQDQLIPRPKEIQPRPAEMKQRIKIVETATKELGTSEDPVGCDAGNTSKPGTCGPVDKYTQKRLEYWCSDFGSFVADKAGMPLTGDPNNWRINAVRNIKKSQFVNVYDKNSYLPKIGDFVTFGPEGNGHIAIIVDVDQGAKKITYIGGNQATADSSNGFAVTKATRGINDPYVKQFIDITKLTQHYPENDRSEVPESVRPGADTSSATEQVKPPSGSTVEATLAKSGQKNGYLSDKYLKTVGEPWGDAQLFPAAADAFRQMDDAFYRDTGMHLKFSGPRSDYRSFADQVAIKKERGKWAATPGSSDHGLGKAVDLDNSAVGSVTYNWLLKNGDDYGYIKPFFASPKGSLPEPWHWEYVGEVAAKKAANLAPSSQNSSAQADVTPTAATAQPAPTDDPVVPPVTVDISSAVLTPTLPASVAVQGAPKKENPIEKLKDFAGDRWNEIASKL